MKKITILLIIFVGAGCSKKKDNNDTDVRVINDITEKMILKPATQSILGLYRMEKDKNKDAYFQAIYVTDRLMNPTTDVHLPNNKTTEEDNIKDDPNYRQNRVLGFYSSVDKAVQGMNERFSQQHELNNSLCYNSIAATLCSLTKSRAKHRYLIIYSDLSEKSRVFNSYLPENLQLMQTEPEKVAELFSKSYPLPNLSRINVIVVYLPQTKEQDERFWAVAGVYSLLLQAHGAAFSVQANNNLHYE